MKRFLILTALLVPLAAAGAVGEPAKDDWQILPCTSFGPIQPQVTRDDLVRLFGAPNVQDLQIEGPEGETYLGTVVFPSDPLRRFKIVWQDLPGKRVAAEISVEGEKSVWKTPQGLTLGMSLKDLEKINGGAFSMTGYEWDYGGRIVSWGVGSLAKALPQKLGLQLDYRPGPTISRKQLDAIGGDKKLPSSHPVLQALNPKVVEISCTWQ